MLHRILVVDDEPDLQVLITQRFRKRIRTGELSFVFAANGEEALDKLCSDGGLDVVLTDINMPVMDGLTLLSRIREAHPMLRSVIVSAYGDMPNIRTALNRGAFDFITKPIDFQDLEITLDKAISEAELRKQAAQDRDRLLGLHRELNLAREIQESLIPQGFPPHPSFEVHGAMIPAAQVGGDLFDLFFLNERRLGFSIGDVSGKGIGAALFMAVSRTALRVVAGKGGAPHECLHEVNRFLRGERRSANMFLTCFYGILDLETGRLEYARAGHNPPYLLRCGGNGSRLERLDRAGGLPLGILRHVAYDAGEAELAPGDRILLYTDGITEAMNEQRELYGEKRLAELLAAQATTAPVAETVRAVTAAAEEFAAGAPANDDITVLGIAYRGADRGTVRLDQE